MNEESNRTYKPAEVARILSERYAHKVTAAVIRKWDNQLLGVVESRGRREHGDNRGFTKRDIQLLNLIAVLRNLGYSLEDTKKTLRVICAVECTKEDQVNEVGEVINRILRQEQGFHQVKLLLRSSVGEHFGARLGELFPKIGN